MTNKRGRQVRDAEVLGAVDLGSNSFHMVIARYSHGQLVVMDRLRESVRLAAGLDRRNRLSQSSQRRALDCLARFGERLRNLHARRVRVVGTNTLRKARGAGTFCRQASRVLGHPVEIISGIEEARLIYLGVSRSLPRARGRQLVVDIGGGSTEIIQGRGLQPEIMESLYMGCVGLSATAFPGGQLTRRAFRAAREAARLELEPIRARFLKHPPARVAGASGTIRAVQDVLLALGRGRKGIRPSDLDFLMDIMIKSGQLDDLQLAGLSADRVQVFPGGLAILAEVLSSLDIDRMVVAEGALREGILHDMLGRLADEDARSRTVRALQARFRIDVAQARRVGKLAQDLRRQVADQWDLERESAALLLGWSAALHELGLDIAHAHHHFHSAYVLEHADMPGFSREEQRLLATLVRCHRRKFGLENFTPLPSEWRVRALRLTVLLRLAVLFNRGRIGVSVPLLAATASDDNLRLALPATWLRDNPLTEADLRREQTHLAAVGIRLTITRRRD